MFVLTGDVGGTKTLLVLFEIEGNDLRALEEKRYETGRYDDFISTVRATCKRWGKPIEAACFGVAGPIMDNRFTGTNLGWSVDCDQFKRDLGIPRTIVINDFCAVGYGIAFGEGRPSRILQTGTRRRGGPIAIIGAGTGLGEAYVTWEEDRCRVHPSEGGHCDFAPRDPRQIALLEYLRRLGDPVTYERIVSGPGLVNIYRFIIDTGIAVESPRIAAKMEREDPAAVISRHAQQEDDRACFEALDLFVSIYGAEAGNLALKILATGGLYIAGGIALHIPHKLDDGTFVRAFRGKGPHRDLLAEIPVSVLLDPRVGILGAARVAAAALTSSG